MDLVIMAAGMGSRFGGLKQVEAINENSEFILDYSIFDCIRAGFDRVVFIIKKENYDLFRETVGKRIENKIKVEYVFQELTSLPDGYVVPEGREKPWGTAHAILCCKDVVKDNFAVINADDFYGKDALKTVYDFLADKKCCLCNWFKTLFKKSSDFALIGYKAKNTLTENGSAKRGVCFANHNGFLERLVESSVEQKGGEYFATPLEEGEMFKIDSNQTVSMNIWGFTPKLFKILESNFECFLKNGIEKNPLKCEYLLPNIVEKAIKEKQVSVKVIGTSSVWYGVTYKEDKPLVVEALKMLTRDGEYPENLWN